MSQHDLSTRARATLVSEVRRLGGRPARPWPARAPEERCDLCGNGIPEDHVHLLQLEERRILCVCGACSILLAGQAAYRPVGARTVWLDDLDLSEERWSAFRIPIGLAFLFLSSASGRVAGLYPSAAGATECELELDAWDELVAANPILAGLEPDAEALIVNRLADPPQHAIVPIDECYRLVGAVRVAWRGISGGPGVDEAVERFFAQLRERASV